MSRGVCPPLGSLPPRSTGAPIPQHTGSPHVASAEIVRGVESPITASRLLRPTPPYPGTNCNDRGTFHPILSVLVSPSLPRSTSPSLPRLTPVVLSQAFPKQSHHSAIRRSRNVAYATDISAVFAILVTIFEDVPVSQIPEPPLVSRHGEWELG
jgi:hypothetical protein